MIETTTEDKLFLAKKLESEESKGDLIALPPEATVVPPSGAVFAEPVIVAQPMQRHQRRVIPDFLQRMKVLAQMAGEEYRYQFPVKNKDGSKKIIEGGTIKMANDLVREYGNCMVDVRVVDQGDSHIFYSRFVDYETGFCMTRPFRQRKGQKTIKTDEERQQDIVFQIGASKAIRNVVLNALGTYADFTYEEAKNSLVEKIGKNLEAWRVKIEERCKGKNMDVKRIETMIGKPLREWMAVDIARVVAELKSISDGMTTFDDLYPDPNAPNNAAGLNAQFLKPEEAKAKQNPTSAPAEPKPTPTTESINEVGNAR